MKALKVHEGLVAPMDRTNVDTDQIIPKQFLKSIKRTGFGAHLFDELRYLDAGYPGQDCLKRPTNRDFVLNQDRYQNASVLLCRENFGCGSSREHAPWALEEYGFRLMLAPSFADIFYNNCFKNGLLPLVMPAEVMVQLFEKCFKHVGYAMTLNLPAQTLNDNQGWSYDFEIDPFRKYCLVEGLDEIDLTLQDKEAIGAFEIEHRRKYPWLFDDLSLNRNPA